MNVIKRYVKYSDKGNQGRAQRERGRSLRYQQQTTDGSDRAGSGFRDEERCNRADQTGEATGGKVVISDAERWKPLSVDSRERFIGFILFNTTVSCNSCKSKYLKLYRLMFLCTGQRARPLRTHRGDTVCFEA